MRTFDCPKEALDEARQRANTENRIYTVVYDSGGYSTISLEANESQPAVMTVYPDLYKKNRAVGCVEW